MTSIVRPVFGERVIACLRCGQGRVEDLPHTQELDAYYSSPAYLAAYHKADQCAILDENAQQLIADRLVNIRRHLPAGERLLDVGASRGYFLQQARALGWKVAGIEIDATAIEFAETNFSLQLLRGTLETISLSRESFDCVHLSHVLEHLRDPVESINRLRDALRGDGLLVIEVPYEFGDLFTRFRSAVLRRRPQPYAVPSPHLHFFTLKTLCRLLRNLGFEIVQAATPRRNTVNESRIPGGRLLKRAVYALERQLHLGPLIEVYAKKRHQPSAESRDGVSIDC